MPIVDFEQDPDGPFGSGNFRDDSGRIMYVHDPDTASTFVKTLAKTNKGIAEKAMGAAAPKAQPDQRLAMNDTGAPIPTGDMSMPAPPMPPTTPVSGTDAAANMSVTPEEVQSLSPEAAVAAVSKVTTPPPAAPLAPKAPPAAAPTGPQKLVETISKATSTAPAGGGLPLVGINTTRSKNVVRGRPDAAVDAQVASEEATGGETDQAFLAAGEAKDEAAANALYRQREAADARGERERNRIVEAQAKRQAVIDEKKRVEAELKKNDESLDPDRVIKNMSTGKTVAMTILAALNGGFGAIIGQKENGVMRVIQDKIEQDIDRQKQEIASGRIRIGNTINELMQQGMKLEDAEAVARDRADAAVDLVAELDAKRLAIDGENLKQQQLFVQQRKEQRAMRRGDLLAQKEDKIQEAESTVVQHERPKPIGATSVEDAIKLGQLRQQRLAELDAIEVSKVLGYVDENGNPRPVANDRAKVVIDGAKDLAVKMPRFEVAENRIRQALTELGVPLEAYNPVTGVIDWAQAGDLRGVGPIDSRPGLKNVLSEGPIAGVISTNLDEAGVGPQPEVDRVRDSLIGIQEDLTYATTGASATPQQIETFRTQSGQALTSEDSVKANLSRTAQTLATQRNAMLSGDKDATKLYRHTLNRDNVSSLKPGVN
jgi:hypothetical protein